jgi:lysophospholipase L1-like esterase
VKPHRRFLILAGLLLFALLVSAQLNCALFRRGEQYYLQLNALRLDPLELNSSPNPALPTTELPLVVFLGDSRAARWPAPYVKDFEFVNRGVEAQTSAQVLARFDAHVKPLRPNILIVQVGINDLKTIPLFPSNRAGIVANCQENIRTIVERSRDLGASVILTTIFPVGRVPIERRPFWSGDVAVAVDEVNAFIHSLDGNGVTVLDAYSILVGDEGSTRPEYAADLIHLAPAGYEELNRALASLLEFWE